MGEAVVPHCFCINAKRVAGGSYESKLLVQPSAEVRSHISHVLRQGMCAILLCVHPNT